MRVVRFGVIALVLALGLPGIAHASTCDNPSAYDLYAGRNILVGCVYVCNDADTLTVTFDTSQDCDGFATGWPISETHLAVSTDADDIPQKRGNPIPGRFPHSQDHNPAVLEYSYIVEFDTPGDVYIAAHAVVWDPASEYSLRVCSDGNETYTAYNNFVEGPDAGATEPRTGTPQPAAEPFGEQTDAAASIWDDGVGQPFTGGSDCADWIWEDNFGFSGDAYINQAVNPVNGDRVEFTDVFNLPGPAVGGTLYATCDNAYEAYVNTTIPGTPLISGQTGVTADYPDWWTSDLRQGSVDTGQWQSVEQGSLTDLVGMHGPNFLFFRAANEYMDADDEFNGAAGDSPIGNNPNCLPDQCFVPTAFINPAGIIWQADIDYLSESETAWGGLDPFPGRNWAKYITYLWD